MKYFRWGRTTCPSGAEIVYKGRHRAMCGFVGFSIIEQVLSGTQYSYRKEKETPKLLFVRLSSVAVLLVDAHSYA